MKRPVLNLLRLTGYPILGQLHLEEALLRATKANWCIINDGCQTPAIVLGVSGAVEEHVHIPEASKAGVQVIKRFTGGGTVVVDHDTVFATLIVEGSALPSVDCYPRPIMAWTESLYGHVFNPHGPFKARENDYVFEDVKFGGNAQAITGRRWLHHTSFLWSYQPQRMRLLRTPHKKPQYRQDGGHEEFVVRLHDRLPRERGHEEFVVQLRDRLPSRPQLLQALCEAPTQMGFNMQEATLQQASKALGLPHHCGTKVIDLSKVPTS